tara:strand:+ start:429 stop:962 length:534 start_codon:yes stop_codon:yes gene_type:complete
MTSNLKNTLISFIFSIFFLFSTSVYSQDTYFLDFTHVLNKSKAGKEAQDFMKNKIKKENEKFKKIEKNLLDQEKDLISKKKLMKNDEYKKKVNELRKKVSDLQKDRNNFLKYIAKTREDSRKKLLENLNPILTSYMKEKNIMIILDKKNVLVGNNKFDLTPQILEIFNGKIKSLNLK